MQVRLDNKEYQAFMKCVKKTGLSQEVYLRHLISGLVPQEAPPSEYFDFMKELYRVGNNLNQVAQKAVRQFEKLVQDITRAVILPRSAK